METSRLRRENAALRRRNHQRRADRRLGRVPQAEGPARQGDQVERPRAAFGRAGVGQGGRGALYPHPFGPRLSAVCHGVLSVDRARADGRGAVRPRNQRRGVEKGLLEQAHGGRSSISTRWPSSRPAQSKILRVLTEQQFVRVGGSDKVRVDLRVISSTTRNLRAEIAAGRFRQELYDRLNVVPIAVPALGDRREDIPALARHFLEVFNKAQGLPLRRCPKRPRRCCRRWTGRQHPPAAQRGRTGADPR